MQATFRQRAKGEALLAEQEQVRRREVERQENMTKRLGWLTKIIDDNPWFKQTLVDMSSLAPQPALLSAEWVDDQPYYVVEGIYFGYDWEYNALSVSERCPDCGQLVYRRIVANLVGVGQAIAQPWDPHFNECPAHEKHEPVEGDGYDF